MLFSYIQQFVSPGEAKTCWLKIFSRVCSQLEAAFRQSLVLLLAADRGKEDILEHLPQEIDIVFPDNPSLGEVRTYYFSSWRMRSEHQWVFRELFLHGRQREELARQCEQGPGVYRRMSCGE